MMTRETMLTAAGDPSSMRRMQWVLIGMLMTLLAAIGVSAWAQTPPPAPGMDGASGMPHGMYRSGMHGGGMHGGMDMGPGMMFRGSPERIGRAVDFMLDGLQATDAQRAQIKQIAVQAAADLKAQAGNGKALRQRSLQLFTAPTIDAGGDRTDAPADAAAARSDEPSRDPGLARRRQGADARAARHDRRAHPRPAGAHGRPHAAHAARRAASIMDHAASSRAPRGARAAFETAMTPRILLIDDDARLASMVADYLGHSGFEIETAGSLAAGRTRLAGGGYDALVLDLMLPDGDGLELCRELRSESRTRQLPLLMLTARGEPMDRIVGLELGADDYLPKPFEPRELLARVKALLRRASPQPAEDDVLRFGRLEIDLGARVARLDGKPCDLTGHQFDLLVVLAQSPGRVLSRDQIMDSLKGHPLEAFDRSIDVHISRIRAVIEDDPKAPRRVLTVRGAGYVFARKQDADDSAP